MQTLRKKTSPLKYRNEPARFFGDGVVFKAKLIGILEVGEARGDRMCQEALQDLKVAIRAAGEHKQKITIHVTIEGLRLRDEKTGESLYHHPVHKISFIAQDMTDSRSFGYIFGSPDCGHRFFGIKTDKAASQVVLAMRDLFQCVFELKKKEIELAKQHIQNRITAHEHQQVKNSILDHKKIPSSLIGGDTSKSISKAEKSPEATANLVDLEQELSSIQRGITQMERITPSEEGPKSVLDDDPFGDSFTNFSSTPFSILPPPTSSKRNLQKQNDDSMSEFSSIMTKSSTPPIPPFPSAQPSTNDSWVNMAASSSVFDEPESNNFNDDLARPRSSFDDNLDPLGTGRSKPYVDKKYFFQDLKNPPKRVLKDLSEQESIFDAHFSPQRRTTTGHQPLSLESSLTASSGVFDSLKSIDPFEEEDFSKINIDQFETTKSVSPKSIILPDTKISSFGEEKSKQDERKLSDESYGSALHVDLPPESWNSSSFSDPKRLERQGSDSSSRNVFSVDAFSKKLPKANLFGQRNVKRDSNGINMRRLQESDSLSENEPELPPRPDTGSHEPPPLPPKNHRDTYSEHSDSKNRYSRNQLPPRDMPSRYDYSSRFKSQSNDTPPLPLPSRKVNRSESTYSSTSRPFKKTNDEDDYLAPNPNNTSDIPTLLPPPQKKDPSKLRLARRSETDPKNLDAPTPPVSAKPQYEIPTSSALPILPDITLSQLLTLGIDDLASKLNVPTSKLNTMTIVELTKYLSEFIEKTKQPVAPPTPNDSPVFRVSFDNSSDATFIAKFDDNFGEPEQDDNSFVANFDNFNQQPVSVIPTADRYAVFREIIDQEIQSQNYESFHQESIESNNSNSLEEAQESSFEFPKAESLDNSSSPLDNQFKQSPSTVQMTKIDTKITDAISGAKDRYAALRDIILVEDLFDKTAKPPLASISDSNLSDDIEDAEQAFDTPEVADNHSADNVPTYSISWADAEAMPSEVSDPQLQDDQKSLQIISTSNKDDFEIDDYMKKAISELSLDQRLSPNIQSKSPSFATKHDFKPPSPSPTQLNKPSPCVNDMSTSPIPPVRASPKPFEQREKSPCIVEEPEGEAIEDVDKKNVLDESKTIKMQHEESREKTITPSDMKPVESSESWANFEQDENTKISKEKSATPTNNAKPPVKEKESPYSSDGKNDFKQREKEYHRRWPKPHTSSSSRDVSPWDEDAAPPSGDNRRRPRPHHHEPAPPHHSTDRYARPPGPRRRINSCDEEYDDEYERRPLPPRGRVPKAMHRSKEVLDSENPNWHYPSEHWSDEEDGERSERNRPFDRNAYERSTYGPPYDKRDPKSFPYDRRDYKGYDKRSKYYRQSRNDYDYDPYEMPPPVRGKPPRKEFDDYEGNFERGSRESRSARDYFYDRDRKSFDSNESYDSGRGHRTGSGELSGSYEGGRSEYRDRYQPHNRSLRRGTRSRGAVEDEDSDEEGPARRATGDTGSLTRSAAGGRSSKHIQLDDDVWGGVGPGGKNWKRPASATAGDKMSSGGLSGSDGEKDKRFRRKPRLPKGKEVELRSNYATIRYSQPPRKEYYDYGEEAIDYDDAPSPRNVSPRLNDAEAAAHYARRKHGGPNVRTTTTPRSETKSFSEYSKPIPPRYTDEEEFQSRRLQVRGPGFKKSTSRDLYVDEPKDYYASGKISGSGFDEEESLPKRQPNRRSEFSSEEQTQPQPQGNNKFNFDGFESDFNSSPKQQEQTKSEQPQKFAFETEFSPTANVSKNGSSQQKLRFNENVSVSKFDANSSAQQMFEDDFLEWTPETPASGNIQSSLKKVPGSNLKTNSVFSRHEHIKKSDSVNIFARKSDEDPFENDDFFNDEGKEQPSNGRNDQDPFHWTHKNNFANFDDNKNI